MSIWIRPWNGHSRFCYFRIRLLQSSTGFWPRRNLHKLQLVQDVAARFFLQETSVWICFHAPFWFLSKLSVKQCIDYKITSFPWKIFSDTGSLSTSKLCLNLKVSLWSIPTMRTQRSELTKTLKHVLNYVPWGKKINTWN